MSFLVSRRSRPQTPDIIRTASGENITDWCAAVPINTYQVNPQCYNSSYNNDTTTSSNATMMSTHVNAATSRKNSLKQHGNLTLSNAGDVQAAVTDRSAISSNVISAG